MSKLQSLIFLETIQDAHHFKEKVYKKDVRFNMVDIVSLNPNIHAFLKNNNIPCFSSSEILCENYYIVILDKCNILEGVVSSYFKNMSGIPDYYLNTVMYYLILIWRHFLWNIELVYQTLKRKEYKFISAYMHEEIQTDSPWIEDDQLYLGGIVQKFAYHRKCKFIPLNYKQIKLDNINGSQCGIFSKKYKLILYAVYWLIVKFVLKKRAILVSSPAYNMDKLCLGLRQKDKNIIFFSIGRYLTHHERILSIFRLMLDKFGIKFFRVDRPINFDIPKNIFLNNIVDVENIPKRVIAGISKFLNENEHELIHRNVFFGDYLSQKINIDFVSPLTEMEIRSRVIHKILEKLSPLAVLSQMNLGSNGALGYYSSQIGIPSFLISHGSHVPHNKEYEKREHEIMAKNILFGNYKYLVAQTPFAREMILKRKTNEKNIINVSPLLWGKKVVNKSKIIRKFTITHAGTIKFRHQRRLIFETSDEYVKALHEICDCVKYLENIQLIIKTRPTDFELTEDSLRTLLFPIPNNVFIENSRRFDEVLGETDLLISFSSTTIEEALVNDVPVLLYGGDGRYAHIPVEPFSNKNNNILRPVTFVNSKDDLEKYFEILSLKYDELRLTQFNFDDYKHHDEDTVEFTKYFSENFLK